MSVFVTGSSGFIGRNLSSAYELRGIEVIRHHRNSSEPGHLKWNLSYDLPSKLSLQAFETVVHCAGLAHDTNSSISYNNYRKLNVVSTVNLAKLSIESEVKNFIYISSSKAASVNFNKEGDFYAKSKRQAEEELIALSKRTNMRLTIVRPSLVYGPNVKGNLNKLSNFIKYGICPPLPETNNKKYLIHVDDLAELIIKISTTNFEANNEIIHACEEIPYTTRQIYQQLRLINNKAETKLSCPYFLLDSLRRLSPGINNIIAKTFSSDDFYQNIPKTLNYLPKRSLKDFNKSNYVNLEY